MSLRLSPCLESIVMDVTDVDEYALCRVATYIAEDRQNEIVDPDGGANITSKLERLRLRNGTEEVHTNLAKVPKTQFFQA